MCQCSFSCFSFHVCRPSGLHDTQRRQPVGEKTSETKRKGEKGDGRRRTQKHNVTLPQTPLTRTCTHIHTHGNIPILRHEAPTLPAPWLCVWVSVWWGPRHLQPWDLNTRWGPSFPHVHIMHVHKTYEQMHICTIEKANILWRENKCPP